MSACERRAATARHGEGFTLIELLVVVAVISILASLLMPAAMRALRQAASTQCKNRLSQLYRGLSTYCNTFDQSLPPYAYYYKNDPDDTYERPYKRPYWTEVISRFLYPKVPREEQLNKAIRCPRFSKRTTSVGRGYACNYGHIFRYYTGKLNHNGAVNSSGSMKLIDIQRTSFVLLLMDGSPPHCYSARIWKFRFDRDGDGIFDSYHGTGLKYNGAEFRHDGGLNAVFVDGHVTTLQRQEWATDERLWNPFE